MHQSDDSITRASGASDHAEAVDVYLEDGPWSGSVRRSVGRPGERFTVPKYRARGSAVYEICDRHTVVKGRTLTVAVYVGEPVLAIS